MSGWIRNAEQKPTKNDEYIVTLAWGTVRPLSFAEGMWNTLMVNGVHYNEKAFDDTDVVAWMPFPDAFKEG